MRIHYPKIRNVHKALLKVTLCIVLFVVIAQVTRIIVTPVALQVPAVDTLSKIPLRGKHPLLFFDEPFFIEGINHEKKESIGHHIYGGIVPHHLFPGYMIAEFFHQLSKQKVTRIFLIGPNHHERGETLFLTSDYAWRTPMGEVLPDSATIDSIVFQSDGLITVDTVTLEHEHSIGGIQPFIKYYLPDAKIVPVVVSAYALPEEVGKVADVIRPYVDSHSVVVASVDFSHYLNSQQAQEKDNKTLEVITSESSEVLYTYDNSYLDSPQAVALLMDLMNGRGEGEKVVLHHTNSGILLNDDHIETTSYFTLAYY